MPTYVDSNAAGLNDGTSWTDAYVLISSTYGVAAGEEIWVEDGHVEELTINTTHNWTNGTKANQVKILCVDKTDDSLSTGGVIGVNAAFDSLLLRGPGVYYYGLEIRYWILTLGMGDNLHEFVNCTFNHVVGSSEANGLTFAPGTALTANVVRMVNCTFDDSNGTTWATFDSTFWTRVDIISPTIIPGTTTNTTFMRGFGTDGYPIRITDADLSDFTNLCTTGSGNFHFLRCKTKTGFNLVSTTPDYDGSAIAESCDDGTITDPALGLTRLESHWGSIESTLARYRTDGADDGEQANAFAWDMSSSANAQEAYLALASPPITAWVDAGAQTISVYLAGGATLNDDDFWVECSSPNESTTAQGRFQITRMDPLGTPAALDTDSSSTWTGTGVGTKQQIDISITPTLAGPVTIRCHLAKPSTTVYVDPKISSDGNQRFYNGVQVDGDAGAGGGLLKIGMSGGMNG